MLRIMSVTSLKFLKKHNNINSIHKNYNTLYNSCITVVTERITEKNWCKNFIYLRSCNIYKKWYIVRVKINEYDLNLHVKH